MFEFLKDEWLFYKAFRIQWRVYNSFSILRGFFYKLHCYFRVRAEKSLAKYKSTLAIMDSRKPARKDAKFIESIFNRE